MHDTSLLTPQRRAMLWASMLAETADPTAEEQAQLMRYARGLPAGEPLQHVLYCSQAARPFGEHQLIELLEQARSYNRQHGITGLLCYENAHFVQLIEGPPTVVTDLFGRIERDRRHQRVRVLSTGLGPLRQFTDWQLVTAGDHPAEFYWLTTYLEAHRHRLLLPQVPISEPQLVAQLEAFSHACAEPAGAEPGMEGLVQPDAAQLIHNRFLGRA